jgi:hypothetical protein
MDATIKGYVENLQVGELRQFRNMAVVPIFTSANHSPAYLTMEEALAQELLQVTEISKGGSVPELKVQNTSRLPVLMIDSEELIGAKQNRVLNTSVLLREDSETVIPVSCTEQGRWAYTSDQFADSKTMMTSRLRRAKHQSVSYSLSATQQFRSNQGEIWDEIHDTAANTGTLSTTGALRDVYSAKMDELEEYIKTFESLPEQKGLLVLINGEVVGLDMLSLDSAYQTLHPKFIKSYAMDALIEQPASNETVPPASMDRAQAFLATIPACKEQQYTSVGYGTDYRYEHKNVTGSVLVYEGKVIHMSFFAPVENSGRTRTRQLRPRSTR